MTKKTAVRRRSQQLNVRVTPDLRAEIDAFAQEHGLHIGDVVEDALTLLLARYGR